jgi:hypothetical protein
MPRTISDTEQLACEAFIRAPSKWPHWPILPMKNVYRGWSDPHHMGVIVDFGGVIHEKIPATIQITNLYTFKFSDVASYEKEEYESYRLMIEAGWVVD